MADIDGAPRNNTSINDAATPANRAGVTAVGRLKVDSLITGGNPNPRPGTSTTKFALNGSNQLMNVDGSGTPVVFSVVPSTGNIFFVFRIVVTMVGTGINFTKFGNIAALTNGLKVEIKEGGGALTEVIESPFKKNQQFYEGGFNSVIQSAAVDIFTLTFLFNDIGSVLSLKDSLSELIKITVQDDLTNISSFRVVAQGYEVSE